MISGLLRRYLFSAGCFAAFLIPVGPARADIVVYNAQHETLTRAWAEAFTRATGIKVTLRNGGDMELANQIVQEGAASPGDVFITENSPGMTLVEGAGLFLDLPQDILAEVPEAYRPSSGRWIGVAARSTVFAYNAKKLKPEDLPKSILSLADPVWKGRWSCSPAGADFQAIVGAVLELVGEEKTLAWLKVLKVNAVAYRGNTAAMKGVNAGEVDGAVIYHYYYFGDQAKTGENSVNVKLHYFRNGDAGAFVSVSGAGVLKSSAHKTEALAFVKWLAGAEGQAVLRDGTSFEYAVASGVASNAKLEPLSALQAPKIDISRLNSRKVTELMRQAGIL